jgi:hypothetical protein
MGRAVVGTGVRLERPLWQADRMLLLRTLWAEGIEARITCINMKQFAPLGQQGQGGGSGGGGGAAAGEAVAASAAAAGATAGDSDSAAAGGEGAPACGAEGGSSTFDCNALSIGSAGNGTYSPAPLHPAAEGAVAGVLGAVFDEGLCSSSGALGRAHVECGVDLAGEGGEMHSCVLACPLFRGRRVVLEGVRKERDGEYAWLAMTGVRLQPAGTDAAKQ